MTSTAIEESFVPSGSYRNRASARTHKNQISLNTAVLHHVYQPRVQHQVMSRSKEQQEVKSKQHSSIVPIGIAS